MSTCPEGSTSLERLARLERAHRRTRRIALLALLALAIVPLLAGRSPERWLDEVKSGRFVLVDASGKVRGRFEVTEHGEPRLALADDEGRDRIVLYVENQEAFVALRDLEEHSRAGLSVDQVGRPHFVLFDARQSPRLHAAINEEGQPSLILSDAEGRRPAGLGVHEDGRPWLLPEPGGAAKDR